MGKVNIKPEEKPEVKSWMPVGDENQIWQEFRSRREELKRSKRNVDGKDVESIMREADENYLRYEDDTAEPNMSNLRTNRIFSKIWTAVSQLFTGDVKHIFKPTSRRFKWNNLMMSELCRKSWKNNSGDYQLLLMIYNMRKYGTGIARTYHRKIEFKGKFRRKTDKDGKDTFDEKTITQFDDIYFQNLDPRNVWIDPNARPFDSYSIADWMWKEVMDFDSFKQQFPEDKFPNVKFVQPRSAIRKEEDEVNFTGNANNNEIVNAVEIFYYENYPKDQYIVVANDVMIVADPLPLDEKKLTLVVAPNLLRKSNSIWGVGDYELLRSDEKMQDEILNMSVDELRLAIHPTGFYEGPEDLDNEFFRVEAGVFKRRNPGTKLDLFQRPSPGNAVINWLELLDQRSDDKSGIPRTLAGEITGKTAFEVGTTREEGLKRLRFSLRSLTYALIVERSLRVDLIKQVYKAKQVELLLDKKVIKEYLKEIILLDSNGRPILDKRGNPMLDDSKFFVQDKGKKNAKFFAKRNREIRVPIEFNQETDEFVLSENENFFEVTPQMLAWEGDIEIDLESLIVASRALERNETSTMVNLLLPLFQLPPDIALKPATQLLKSFDKDPVEWLPEGEQWLGAFETFMNPQPKSDGLVGGGMTRENFGNLVQGLRGQTPENTSQQGRQANIDAGGGPAEGFGAGRGVGNEDNPFGALTQQG